MNKEEIKITQKEYKDLYEGWMSKSLKTEGEVMSTYADRELELLYKYIDYTYQILTSIGIFAGFGFTAILLVKTLWLFILGEALLIGTILYGFYWLKNFLILIWARYKNHPERYLKNIKIGTPTF